MSDEIKRIVGAGYDQVAEEYGRLESELEWPRMRWLCKRLDQLKAGSSVLDLGCGSGDPADIEIAKKHKITGVDFSENQIDLARQNVPARVFLCGDAGSMEFPRSSFDAAVSFYTLEHVPRKEHETVLERIHRWLKPEGLFLISIEAGDFDDITGDGLGVPMFISCFEPDVTRQLVIETGLEILETAIENQIERDHEVPYLWILARKRSEVE